MPYCLKHFMVCLAAGLLVAVAGCGSDNSTANSPAAAIGGPDGQEAQPGTESGEPVAGQRASDRLHPTVVFDTSLGSITVRLNGEKAPLTVDNFLSYVDKGHYDDTIFEQVVTEPGQVVLGGAYTAEGVEKTTETPVFNEAHNMLKNRRGTVAMARQDAVDSATCHFFFNLTDNEALDHKDRTPEGYGYCVFGEVIDGMDIVDRIGHAEVHDTERFVQTPVETVMINSVRRIK